MDHMMMMVNQHSLPMSENKLPFGIMIQQARRKKCWTVKWLAEKLGCVTPAELTKIEVHGEIPDIWVIGRLSTVLGLDFKETILAASNNKGRMEDWTEKQKEESTVICTFTEEDYDNYQRKAASRNP